LNLSFNHFSAVPPAIRPLIAVTELNLGNNRIENVNGIGDLVALVILNLDDNNLCELPEEMSQLVKLRQISLKNNRISTKAASHGGQSIPASFFEKTSIDTIDLGGNPAALQKQQLLQMEGVNAFIERRRKQKDKQFSGGVTMDTSLFGLD
jgi:Leucine-rich repeat (LRR) protein